MAEIREAAFGVGAGAVGVTEQDLPLAFRMVENLPGIAASAGFMAFRGSNTLIEGGRFDYRGGRKGERLQRKFRVLDEAIDNATKVNRISSVNRAQFIGGGRFGGGLLGARASRRATAGTAAGGKGYGVASNFNFRAARANIATANPSALRRLGSLTSFMDPSKGMYSPFAAANLLGSRGPVRNLAIKRMGLQNVAANESVFGPGLLSFITAGTKIDRLERKALDGNQRALSKLGRVDQNIKTLASVNNRALMNPSIIRGTQTAGMTYAQALNLTPIQRAGMTATQMVGAGASTSISYGGSFADDALGKSAGKIIAPGGAMQVSTTVGIRGNLMASSMSGQGTRYIAGYFRGAMGYGAIGGLEGTALKGAEKAVAHLAGKGATKYMALGAKGLGLAIPGLNVLATASLVYDLGKMAGEVIKSGINLAKDANKSMQGTINKPLFGMGYKDTEAAATSRSRGVMAIQNSRLNARSMLGSEAAMMAAHYG